MENLFKNVSGPQSGACIYIYIYIYIKCGVLLTNAC